MKLTIILWHKWHKPNEGLGSLSFCHMPTHDCPSLTKLTLPNTTCLIGALKGRFAWISHHSTTCRLMWMGCSHLLMNVFFPLPRCLQPPISHPSAKESQTLTSRTSYLPLCSLTCPILCIQIHDIFVNVRPWCARWSDALHGRFCCRCILDLCACEQGMCLPWCSVPMLHVWTDLNLTNSRSFLPLAIVASHRLSSVFLSHT